MKRMHVGLCRENSQTSMSVCSELPILRRALAKDRDSIVDLLRSAGLPTSDISEEMLNRFRVAIKTQVIAGVVGLEICGQSALLRSLAVCSYHRSTGIGDKLLVSIEDDARALSVSALYLLTTSAATYFSSKGYDIVNRSGVPPAIGATQEFSALCPSEAVCMYKKLSS